MSKRSTMFIFMLLMAFMMTASQAVFATAAAVATKVPADIGAIHTNGDQGDNEFYASGNDDNFSEYGVASFRFSKADFGLAGNQAVDDITTAKFILTHNDRSFSDGDEIEVFVTTQAFGGDYSPLTYDASLFNGLNASQFTSAPVSLGRQPYDPNAAGGFEFEYTLDFGATEADVIDKLNSEGEFSLIIAAVDATFDATFSGLGNTFDPGPPQLMLDVTSVTVDDSAAPTLVALSPADDATGVPTATNLAITFNELVQAGMGDIEIFRASDNTAHETITMPSSQVTFDGATATIDLNNGLANDTEYYVGIASGAIEDIAGNDFAGISDMTTWSFTSAASPIVNAGPFSVSQNAPAGTIVGDLNPDVTGTDGSGITYSMDTSSAFALNPNTGVITVKDPNEVGMQAQFTLTVSADDGTNMVEEPIIINVTDDLVPPPPAVRVSTFNGSMSERGSEGALITALSDLDDTRGQAVAEIIQINNPDILLVNEFDYDANGDAANLFRLNYLEVSQNGNAPVYYPYIYSAPSNTGIPSGVDLDNDGNVGGDVGSFDYADDSFGFGRYPGEFGMVIYSKYPIDMDNVRTFQNFLWKDMPDALLPADPNDADGNGDTDNWYTAAELDIVRLSSKSHWDVPIDVNGEIIHILASHPTPPVFDGNEDRNGTRNHDEIRFWVDYVTDGDYIYDDDGGMGGLADGESFVLVGDMNADPNDGDSTANAANQLTDSAAFDHSIIPSSEGGPEDSANDGGINDAHTGDPAYDTSDFGDPPGNLRVDYALPSADLDLDNAEVFWPVVADPQSALVGTSDHRMVSIDLDIRPAMPITTPMMVPVAEGYETTVLHTVGQSYGDDNYTPIGVLDGLGATELDANTVRVYANHEILHFRGYEYEVNDGNGGTFSMVGARISYFDVDKTTREIVASGLAYDTVYDANGNIASDVGFLANDTSGFSRFCSANMIEAHQFGNGVGIEDPIFFSGEEDGGGFSPVGGAEWALDIATDTMWQLPDMGRGAWENVTEIDTGTTTHVAFILGDDTSPIDFGGNEGVEAAPLYLYVGEKDASGDFPARNGLRGGNLYVWVSDTGETSPADFNGSGSLTGTWVEVDNVPQLENGSEDGSTGFDEYGYPTQGNLWLQADALGAFGFSRPEDVATNPFDGSMAVMASTGVDTFENGVDTFGTTYTIDTDFSDFDNLKGELVIIYDGDADTTRALRSPDNLEWAADGYIYIQEDEAEEDTLDGEPLFGEGAVNPNEAGVVRVDPATGETMRVSNIDRSVVLDASIAEPNDAVDDAPNNAGEWESSGIVDVSDMFGEEAGTLFLLTVQAHTVDDQERFNPTTRIRDSDLGEAGQLLFLSAPERPADGVTLTLLHNNDGESALLPTTNSVDDNDVIVGGVDAFKSVTDREIADANASGNALIDVYAGDSFLASAALALSLPPENGPVYDAIAQRQIPYTAHVFGNHEFDYSPSFLERYLRAFDNGSGLDQPFLSANLDFSAQEGYADLIDADGLIDGTVEDDRPIARSFIYNDPTTGAVFGIVGATTFELENISSPGDVTVTDNLTDTVAAVQAEIDRLENMGVNKIILVSHMQAVNTDKAMLALLSGVDIAVGGGGDEILVNNDSSVPVEDQLLPGEDDAVGDYPTQVTDADGETVYLVTAKGQYQYVGRLDVVFDENGDVTAIDNDESYPRRVIPDTNDAAVLAELGVDDAVTPDAAIITSVIEPVRAGVEDFANDIIANLEVTLIAARSSVRAEESNLGNLVADAFIWTYEASDSNIANPVVAVQNGGGIRQNAGDEINDPLTREDTLNILPFSNQVAVLRDVTPEDFKAVMERSVADELPDGGFLQIGGFRVTYDLSQPIDSRVLSIIIDDEVRGTTPIVVDGAIVANAPNVDLVANTFTAGGGDGYDVLESYTEEILPFTYEGALIKYLQEDDDSFPDLDLGNGSQPTVTDDDPRYQIGGNRRITFVSPVTLTLLHNNDGESALLTTENSVGDDDVTVGGVAAFKAVFDREMADAQAAGNALVNVYAGDSFLASATLALSLPPADGPVYDAIAQRQIPYTAHVFGNHEFDYSPSFLERYLRAFDAGNGLDEPFLSANLDFSAQDGYADLIDADGLINGEVEDDRPIARSMIYTDPATGAVFGIVGATTFELENISSPGDVTVTATLEETAAAVQTEIDRLEGLGVDKIILVSHMQAVDTDKAMIALLSGVDIAVGGGGDEILVNNNSTVPVEDQLLPGEDDPVGDYPTEVSDADGETVYLVTAKGQYKYVGRLDIVFDTNGDVTGIDNDESYPRRVVPDTNDAALLAQLGVEDAVTPDAALITSVIEPVEAGLADFANDVIANLEVTLDAARTSVRFEESNLGNLVTDAFIWTYEAHDSNIANPIVAVQNGGGIRQNAGDEITDPLTREDTLNILPFSNQVAVLHDVTPADFKAAMEIAIGDPLPDGGFLQVGGFRILYDVDAAVGSRVISITLDTDVRAQTPIVVNGVVVENAPNVDIVTNSFVARGGDGYDVFENYEAEILPFTYEGALVKYLEEDAASFPRLDQGNGLEPTVRSADERYQRGGNGRIIKQFGPPTDVSLSGVMGSSAAPTLTLSLVLLVIAGLGVLVLRRRPR